MTGTHELNAQEGGETERYGEAALAFAMLTYTLPGVPMVYAGQEVGHEKVLSRFEADTLPDYGCATKIGALYRDFYTKLGELRSEHPALWQKFGQEASFKLIETSTPEILAFEREVDGDRVMVFVNLSNEPQDLNFPGAEPSIEKMENRIYPFVKQIPARFGPWEFHVFTNAHPEDPDLPPFPRRVIIKVSFQSEFEIKKVMKLFWETYEERRRLRERDKHDKEILDRIRKGDTSGFTAKAEVRKKREKWKKVQFPFFIQHLINSGGLILEY